MASDQIVAVAHLESRVSRIDPRPDSVGVWLTELWRSRSLLGALARKEFRARYKRASLGALWAVAVPLLQAVVIAFVFSRVAKFGQGEGYSYVGFVLSGVVVWFYTASTVPIATSAIVDGAGMADKIWFPRAILALVPGVANLVTLAVSGAVLLIALPVVGEPITPRLLVLLPAAGLLVLFIGVLDLVLAALHTYFRDVKYIVQALVLIWFYTTPIIYPQSAMGSAGRLLDFNPLTGIVGVFHWAAVDAPAPSGRALGVSFGVTLALTVVAVEVYRRHDRLFVDLL